MAYIDKEGYVQITDRLKDVIKTGGEWISSLDLENMSSQHESISEAATIGIPDEIWGERPLVIAVLNPEFKDKVSTDDVRQFLTQLAEAGRIVSFR